MQNMKKNPSTFLLIQLNLYLGEQCVLKGKERREERSFENLSLIQTHIESDLLKMEGTFGSHPNPYSQTGQLEQVAQHLTRSGPECLQTWRCCNLSGQPVPEFDQPQWKKGFFLCLSEISHLSVHTHCPVARYYCKESLYSLLQEFILIGKILLNLHISTRSNYCGFSL